MRYISSGPWFKIKMTSYQYRKSHCGDKTILRPSYLHNGISYTGKMSSLYWIRAQVSLKLAVLLHSLICLHWWMMSEAIKWACWSLLSQEINGCNIVHSYQCLWDRLMHGFYFQGKLASIAYDVSYIQLCDDAGDNASNYVVQCGPNLLW